jgi:streptomycin 6-kinase
VLLHGDFIGKNLLRTADEYVAADPLPRLGDPCADVGAVRRRPAARGHDPRPGCGIAGRMGLDPRRARRWAAVLAVLLTAQARRDDQAALDALMDTGDLRTALDAGPR